MMKKDNTKMSENTKANLIAFGIIITWFTLMFIVAQYVI